MLEVEEDLNAEQEDSQEMVSILLYNIIHIYLLYTGRTIYVYIYIHIHISSIYIIFIYI